MPELSSPTHDFRIEIGDDFFDLTRIATSGQMFRWRSHEEGFLVADGSHFLFVRHQDGILNGYSSRGQDAVLKLFRLEESHESLRNRVLLAGPELEPYVAQTHGLRIMRPTGRAETLFSFLCSSCNHVSRITSMVWKLAQRGDTCQFGSETLPAFPCIERLAEVTEEELRSEGFGYRGATIPKVARQLQARGGESYLEGLAAAGYEVAQAELMSLPGIGRKIADCVCLFALDYGQAVPIDTHIWQQLTALYFPEWRETSLTDTKYLQAARFFRERFGPDAGAAHQFLFVENMENWRAKQRATSPQSESKASAR
jgi:N-glycosylase/DNA lyase